MPDTTAPAPRPRLTPAQRLLQPTTLYFQPEVLDYDRGREILGRYPDAERVEVPSHQNIPGLFGNEGAARDWVKIKRTVLVLGVRKTFPVRPNGRSADFIAPGHASGCLGACLYCVAEGTLITTPEGPRPVEQIQDGERVFAYDSSSGRLVQAAVCGTASRVSSEVLEIEVGDRVLRVTAEHPIMTYRGWVNAGELTHQDRVLCVQDELACRQITHIRRIEQPTRVYNFHVPGPESYLANGVVTHNCYVPRHKGYANPVTLYVNIEGIAAAIKKHAARQGPKTEPNQTDPHLWTYDIGENSDCSADAMLSDNVRDLVELFKTLPNAKATWATKFVNRDLLDWDPQGHTRIRFSLMPADTARVLDVRTSPVAERLAAVNDFVEAGYEVHLNFSPVVVTDGWQAKYAELFEQVNDALSPQAKQQVAAEVIFLTHHAGLHDVNVRWHPKGEALIWRPDLQEAKTTGQGGDALRYRHGLKGGLVGEFRHLLARKLPYCRVRYAF